MADPSTTPRTRFRPIPLGMAWLVVLLLLLSETPGMLAGGSTHPSAAPLPTPLAGAAPSPESSAAQPRATPSVPLDGLSPEAARGVPGCSTLPLGCALSRPGSAASNASGNTWLNLTPLSFAAPERRACAGMAYDSRDGYAVLYSGCGPGKHEYDTWTFAHGVWSPSNATGPGLREFPSMVYDAAGGYVLLFGGDRGGIALNDTWSFAGGTWTRINGSVAPPARTRAAMAYDPQDGTVLLTSGYSTTGFSDLTDSWAFSNGSWSLVPPKNGTKPPARDTASLAYDSVRGEFVLFGGFSQKSLTVLNDTWTFRTGQWRSVAAPHLSPKAREGSSLFFDPIGNRTLLFGGDTNFATLNDLWEFNGSGWAPADLASPPSPRTGAPIVWDAVDGYALLFGGNGSAPAQGADPLGDTYSLGPNLSSSLQVSPGTVDIGESVTLSAAASYNGTPSVSYSYDALPPGCVTNDSPTLRCTSSAAGTFTVVVTVSAAWGSDIGETRANVSFTVHALPSFAGLSALPNPLTYNQWLTVESTITGGTGPMTFYYWGLPPACTSTNRPRFTCLPNGTVPGGFPHTFRINASVTDSRGRSNGSSVSLTIDPAPSIAPGSFRADPSVTDVGVPVTFSASVSGGVAPLSYRYTGLPPGCPSQNLSGLTCWPNATGNFSVRLVVVDANGYATAAAATSLSVNPPPRIDSFAVYPSVVDVGQRTQLSVNASGGTGIFRYAFDNLPSGCASSGYAVLFCTPSRAGLFSVRATVFDEVGGNDSRNLTLEVRPDPAITNFSAVPDQIDLGQNFSLIATTSGGSPPLAFLYEGLPPGCPGSNASQLTCRTTGQTLLGSYTIRLIVQDGLGVGATRTTLLTLRAPPKIGLFNASPDPVVAGSSTTFSVRVSEGTGAYSYLYGGLPVGCSTRDAPTLECAPTGVGAYAVQLRVTDQTGYSVFANASLRVEPAPVGAPTGGTSPLTPLDGSAALGATIAGLATLAALGAWGFARRRRRGDPIDGGEAEGDLSDPADGSESFASITGDGFEELGGEPAEYRDPGDGD